MSVLERQRHLHELIEQTEKAIVSTYKYREKLLADHAVSSHLESISKSSLELLSLYQDTKGERRNEIQLITTDSEMELNEFYARLKLIKEIHRRAPNALALPMMIDNPINEELEQELEFKFFGEETYGKCLDLNAQYELYNNLSTSDVQIPKLTYLEYLNSFDQFRNPQMYPMKIKNNKYKTYLVSLEEYLIGFFIRAKPLIDLSKHQKLVTNQFNVDWENKEPSLILGWEKLILNADSDEFYCQYCKKQYTKETVFEAHKSGKKHLAAVTKNKTNGNSQCTNQRDEAKTNKLKPIKDMISLEMMVFSYVKVLETIRSDSVSNVERKMGLTDKERKEELESDQQIQYEEFLRNQKEANTSEDRIYNPLKVPLGWDGKPIPFWLYKLHGLGVEYSCQICGDYVYMGRKAFEQHFREFRHVSGLKALGIPSSKHFNEVTQVKDAYALWEKIRNEINDQRFQLDTIEEFEDEQGNVFNKKTYDDMKRQGLI